MTTETIYRTEAGRQRIMAAYGDAMVHHWPPHASLRVPTRHGETAVFALGDPAAPPLVLLHGAGSNSATWAGDAPAFAEHFRVYAVDLIGEPTQSAPSRPPWAGPAFAEWLADTLEGLGLRQATLLGLSQGGWAALKLATAAPERVDRLVLLAPGGVVADRPAFLLRAIAFGLRGERGIEGLKRTVLGDTVLPPEMDAYLTLLMTEFKPRVGKLPIFSDGELARLTMPVLLVGGAKDAVRDNEAIAARLRRLLPRFEAVMLPDAGHALTDTRGAVMPFLLDGYRITDTRAAES
jgi:pimeloyl-ACP methyl ester carboxylesterase